MRSLEQLVKTGRTRSHFFLRSRQVQQIEDMMGGSERMMQGAVSYIKGLPMM